MTSQAFWRKIQLGSFHDLEKLASFLELSEKDKLFLLNKPSFPLMLPLRLAEKIEKGTLLDPILRQFVPLEEELILNEDFVNDPVGDSSFRKESKLIRKYNGRALLVTSSACAIHCRYCFRKNFEYETKRKDFEPELRILENDPSLSEIILSGGDPLSLSNEALEDLLKGIARIPHIKRIRFHTRFPVGIPERIDPDLLFLFKEIPKQFFFIVHTNHPKELDEDLFYALKKIQKLGIPVLNQTVLLKGINDSFTTLQTLFSSLADRGIIPYYLHRLDPVTGTTHFAVEKEKGKELMRELAKVLSGYALPKYVEEIPGASSKTLIWH